MRQDAVLTAHGRSRRGRLRRAARPAASVLREIAAGTLAAAAARGAYAVLRRHPPGGEETWTRTNHRGEPVTLLEGPAVAIGAIAAEAAAAAVAGAGPAPAAIALAGAGALGFGVIDDLAGSGHRRGLRGHLGALARGEVTTGSVKLAGLAATGIGCAALISRARVPADQGVPAREATASRTGAAIPVVSSSAADVLINAGLIAGGANLLNLFDLRPGRAIKVAALSASLVAGAGALPRGHRPAAGRTGAALAARHAGVAAPLGAAVSLLPEDLGERAMLGDAGANALGAMLGAAAATSLPRSARVGLLAGIVALTLASEKVSFTRVIERTPPLRWLDMLGRRPALPVALSAAAPATARVTLATSAAVSTKAVSPAVVSRAVVARPAQLPARRRQAGRHRRVGARVSRVRSGAWLPEFLKKTARQDP